MTGTPPPQANPMHRRLDAMAARPVVHVGMDDRLVDVARLMATRRLSCVPIVDAAGRVHGMVSELQLLAALRGDLDADTPVLAASEPLLAVDGGMPCDQAWQLCLQRGVAHLAVVDADQRLTGLVSETDFRMWMHLSMLAGHHLVPSVMQPVARVVRQDEPLREAARAMGLGSDASVVVVDAAGTAVGVLTARDAARCLQLDTGAGLRPVAEVMSRPVLAIDTRATLNQAADRMLALQVRHLVVLDDQGRLVGMLSSHDLARAMAVGMMDASIAQERARQRAILDALPDLVWLKDPDGVYLACNPRFEQLYGQPEAQIVGRTDQDFVAPEVAAFFRQHDLRAMAANTPSSNEELLRFASDGHTELTHTIKTPVRDAQGRLLGVLGIGRDITALRQVEDGYRQLFSHNPAPMAVYARHSQRLVAVNDAFCALYGCSPDEALQLEVADLLMPAQQGLARASIPTMHGLLSAEWQHQRRDGTPMQVLVQSHDLVRDGVDCRLVVITDITRLHRSQQRDQSRLRLLDSLVRGDALADQLRQLALDHEAAFPGSLCVVLLADEAGHRLHLGAAPSLPDDFTQAVHGMAIEPGICACGSACHIGERVVTENIATDPRWGPLRDVAARAGLVACWATPVPGAGGRPLGSFAIYRRHPGLPGEEELDHASFAAGLAALAVGQHRSAERLRDSERRLADTLQAVPDPIWLKDRDGQLLLANAAYRRLVAPPDNGSQPGLPLGDASRHNQAALAADDAAVARSGAAATAERWLSMAPDNRRALFEVVTTPMHDAQGQVAGVLGAARDITQIKQGAQALADQSRLVDTMFSQTTDAIVLLDPQTQAFVTFNDAACNGLGYSREAFARLRPQDLHMVQAPADVQARQARVMAGEQITFDITHRRRDGGPQHAQVTLRRIDFSGRPLVSVVWRDLTENRAHADRIRRLNQAYAVLSGVNEAIVRLHDPLALQAEVCRIAVDVGGFRQAWIGRPDAAGALLTDACSGSDDGTPAPWDAAAAAALRGGGAVVLDDPAASGRSVAAFLITPAGAAPGVLALLADTTGHFDNDQLALYARLVRDVGHAIESIAAEAARRQEQRLREQLMESVAGLFFVLDAQGSLLLWNRRLEALTGLAADAVRTSAAVDYFAPDDRPAVQAALQRVMAGEELQIEAPLRLQGGRRVPYLLVARRVDLDTGPVIVGSGIDITDRLRAERELAQHRQHLEQLVAQRTAELEQLNRRLAREDLRLRAMFGLSQRAATLDEAALWQHGIDALVVLVGSALGCLHTVAADGQLGACTWSGATQAAPQPGLVHGQGQAAAALACAEALQRQAPAVAPLLIGSRPYQVLAVPVLDHGRAVLVLCAAHPLAADGQPAVPAAVAHDMALAGADLWDIVQRRRTEIALAQAKAAADAANQAKSAFLANMSHEIRTPLNAVLGFAHLLRREPLSPRQQDHLGKIADASQHLLQVINDILDFSKIEASKVVLAPSDFALLPSLQRMVAMVADRARVNLVQLQVVVDAASPAQVHGDQMRLEQILLNLLSNAVKFTPGGQVWLRVRPLAPGWLRFEVQDTGIGIDAAQQPLLFRPFEQADASTTRRFGGTGLGLAICHRLALLMGGRIGLHSALGQGSQFWLELPLPTAGHAAPEPALPPAPVPAVLPELPAPPGHADRPLRGLQVLLAEDNPINQEVALELLTAQGARVDVADDGEQAVQRAGQGRYDLVLMDVQMPRMDGLRAAAAIRQLPGWARVPIIAMTASAFAEDRTDCLAAGMDDVLVKPVEPEALTRCLLQWWAPADQVPQPAALPVPAVPASAVPAVAVRTSLLSLRRLLQSHDTAAADHLAQQAPLLTAALGPQLAALGDEVQAYAFDAAVARVDALLAAVPG